MPAEYDANLKALRTISTVNPEPSLTEILLVKILKSGFRFSGCPGYTVVLSCVNLFSGIASHIMQKFFVFSFFIVWLALCGVMSLGVITYGASSELYLVWALLFCLPFLLRPLAWAERQFRPEMTLICYRRRRAWVHLAPWQPTTDLTSERVHHFWQSVNTSTRLALEKNHTVIISSHLLTCIRARRVLSRIQKSGLSVKRRTYRIPFTPGMRALMQLEILFRQWRWRTDFRTDWPVLVIRRKSTKPKSNFGC
ncbi:hypothetical protein [Enterobacter vonholyi]